MVNGFCSTHQGTKGFYNIVENSATVHDGGAKVSAKCIKSFMLLILQLVLFYTGLASQASQGVHMTA